MSATQEPSSTPAERVSDLPRILHEMSEGVREALIRHRRLGNPVAVWRDGRVQWIPQEEIPTDFANPPERGG